MNFARENGQQVRGHTLLWHNQLPAWLTQGVASGDITPGELCGILRKHVTDVVSHFRGRINQWDVVNEVIDDNANLRDTLWLQNKYSWVPGFFDGEGAANLLDENFGPKPAYQAVQATLALGRPG